MILSGGGVIIIFNKMKEKKIMTSKQFSKLKRKDLLQMLIIETEQNVEIQNRLKEQNQELREKLDIEQKLTGKLKTRLDEKDVKINELENSLAEKENEIKELLIQLSNK